tara:strand:- start:332 stop:673 length:342 start_codon:yes stop_codon:yes gene_type:complete
MQTASLTNLLLLNATPEPYVGQPATLCGWTDRTPGTVIEIVRFRTGARAGQVKAVHVQEDTYTRTDNLGMSDGQTYNYARDPSGRITEHKIDKCGRFEGLSLGVRERYYDYSF